MKKNYLRFLMTNLISVLKKIIGKFLVIDLLRFCREKNDLINEQDKQSWENAKIKI